MNGPQPSPATERLLRSRLIRRAARSRVGRRLHLDSRQERRLRRHANERIASRARSALEATHHLSTDPVTPIPLQHLTDAATPSAITTRFVILTEDRSGSNLLVSELNRRWPEIRSRGEEFGRSGRDGGDSFEDLAHRTFIEDTGERIVGCKIFPVHVTDEELAALLGLDGMRVIVLRRHNQLRRYLSGMIARSTGTWHRSRIGNDAGELRIEQRTITIDRARLLSSIIRSQREFERLERLVEGLPRLDLSYEDLSTDLDGELRRVAGFLGAGEPAHQAPPQLLRQNPDPLDVLIENFDQISEFLHDVGLAEFLTLGEQTNHASRQDSIDEPGGTAGPRWPTESQRLLLQALLGREESFEDRWNLSLSSDDSWTRSGDLSALYPAIHHRIRRAGLVAPTFLDFRAASMHNTARKIRLLEALRRCTASLAAADLEITLLGSTALLARWSDSDSASFRILTVTGLDLFAEPTRFGDVVAGLSRLGWSAATEELTGTKLTMHRDDLELRLHRSLLHVASAGTIPPEPLERDLRTGLIAVPSLERTVTMPAPAELLISTIINGMSTEPTGSIDWVLDAHHLIMETGDELDWTRVHALTASDGTRSLVVGPTELILDVSDGLLPPTAVAALGALRSTESIGA